MISSNFIAKEDKYKIAFVTNYICYKLGGFNMEGDVVWN
jgi:hypothetical protein